VLGVEDYRALNRARWDERAPAHAASPDYCCARFVGDPAFLSDVVRFDVPLLGDITGRRGVHLQCHIGTDTLSLSRLGARMTGLDFSAQSLVQARRLAAAAGAGIAFVQADVYDAVDVLGAGAFDLVFTGVGALCWLPDIRRWADVVAGLLSPGGRLFVRETHPALRSLEYGRDDGLLVVDYAYFEREEPDVCDGGGTYVETDAVFQQNLAHSWNHGMGQIVTALLAAGMDVTGLVEHDSVPWQALPGQMERIGGGEWRLVDRPWRVPHTYTLQAVRRV
jgi:SAM-dependent methyltransferase